MVLEEELYQKASDELNSDRRRAHIWARACALSKNDHDEARYLYTNLRVEELLTEHETGVVSMDDTSSLDHNATVAMDPISGSTPSIVLPLDDTFDTDSTLSLEPLSSLDVSEDINVENDPLLQDLDSDQAMLSPMEKQYYEKHPDQLKELEEDDIDISLQQGNEELDALLDGVRTNKHTDNLSDAALTADFTDATSAQAILINEELDWLDTGDSINESQTSLQRLTPSLPPQDETDRFTQDLLRQVDDLPGQRSDVVASDDLSSDEDNTWQPSPRANEAAVGTAAAIGAARYGQANEKSQARRSTSQSGSSQRPLDLTDRKSGTEYTVFRRDSNVQAVKNGVSWSALFFTTPYLIYRHMFGTAIVYTIMSLVVAAGLLFMGLNWLDAGTAATSVTKYTTLGFGLLALIGILYIPFRHANTWRSEKLERRGFELVARVKAKSPGKAIAMARRESALD